MWTCTCFVYIFQLLNLSNVILAQSFDSNLGLICMQITNSLQSRGHAIIFLADVLIKNDLNYTAAADFDSKTP